MLDTKSIDKMKDKCKKIVKQDSLLEDMFKEASPKKKDEIIAHLAAFDINVLTKVAGDLKKASTDLDPSDIETVLQEIIQAKENENRNLQMLQMLGINCESKKTMINSLSEIIQDDIRLTEFISALKLKTFW